MKYLQYVSLLLLMAMAACSDDSFRIDGNLANLDNGEVRVTFLGDSGVVDEWVNADKQGKFAYKGHSSQPVLVTIADHMGNPLAMLVATDGDHLKVSGDAAKATDIKVKGNRLNEDWQLFRDEHKAFYSDANPARLDAAIEKYVREHPDDVLSTVLLLADYSDYSDRNKLNALIDSIAEQARPESLLLGLNGNKLENRMKGHLPRLMTLDLITTAGVAEEFKLTNQITLIHLWAKPQDNRQTLIDKLQGVGEGVHIIDILAESDTIQWHKTIASDPKGWKHYWAPGGPLEQGIQLLGFTSVPWYAVTDSAGLVIYSGSSLDAAMSQAKKK